MKIIVAGSRSVDAPTWTGVVWRVIRLVTFNPPLEQTILVSGCASGADEIPFLLEDNYPELIRVEKFPADWDKHGKKAGYIRNKEMGEYADFLIAVWDGESKGTKHMINIMLELKKPLHVFTGRSLKNA